MKIREMLDAQPISTFQYTPVPLPPPPPIAVPRKPDVALFDFNDWLIYDRSVFMQRKQPQRIPAREAPHIRAVEPLSKEYAVTRYFEFSLRSIFDQEEVVEQEMPLDELLLNETYFHDTFEEYP